MADETRIQVLHEKERKVETDSFMWRFHSGEDILSRRFPNPRTGIKLNSSSSISWWKNVMSYVIKSCFRLSSIAIVHLRKSWTSLAPMTSRNKPGSRRNLIFQEVHSKGCWNNPSTNTITLSFADTVYCSSPENRQYYSKFLFFIPLVSFPFCFSLYLSDILYASLFIICNQYRHSIDNWECISGLILDLWWCYDNEKR